MMSPLFSLFHFTIWHDMILYHSNMTLWTFERKLKPFSVSHPSPAPLLFTRWDATHLPGSTVPMCVCNVQCDGVLSSSALSSLTSSFSPAICWCSPVCTVFIIIFDVPSFRFSTQPSPILLHSSLLYSLKELDFKTGTLSCCWNGGRAEKSVF